MPRMVAGILMTGPVDHAAEPLDQRPPGGSPLVVRVGWMVINPVLKCVDGGDPGQDQHNSLEQLAVGPVGIGLGVERLKKRLPRRVPLSWKPLRRTPAGFRDRRPEARPAKPPSVWKACPPSWSRVRTSPSSPTAFMKMNEAAGLQTWSDIPRALAFAIGQVEQAAVAQRGDRRKFPDRSGGRSSRFPRPA